MEPAEFLLAWTTAPTREAADGLARGLVERRLAACVTIVPGARSTYRWQDRIEQADEFVLMVKAPRARWAELERAVTELHPYEVPELIATPLVEASAPYRAWMAESTK